jgi:hypothetical protein
VLYANNQVVDEFCIFEDLEEVAVSLSDFDFLSEFVSHLEGTASGFIFFLLTDLGVLTAELLASFDFFEV